ncbi:MAG: ABC transporter ATP-binding protein [Acidimicrobiales bacterium]|nr:ABC transporter ATP-binding protein [Acidimicrobiales bacterium]
MAAAEVVGLTKRYGSLFALQNLTLRIEQGAVFGLIGPNGAGKSTTFSVWATLLKPTAGQARVHGLDPVAHPRDVRKLVGYMPDVLGVYDNLRVDEYLEFFAHSYRIPRKQWKGLVDGLLELVDLGPKRESMVNSLSRGMKQRLSLARALVHDPKLLILDEPASGLDPRARIELRELLAELKAMGKTIVISSHILSELEAICTDIGILEAGRLLAAGTPASIRVQLGSNRTIDVRFADGTTEKFAVAGDEEQRELLQRLVVDEGRPVVEFRQSSGGLEDIFLQLTEGIVQ